MTVVHVKFARGVASARGLPDFRLASQGTRKLLRRYRVAVVGGSFWLRQQALDDLFLSLGAEKPGPECGILTTYIGPATDGEGHILTQPTVNVSIRCEVTVNGVTCSRSRFPRARIAHSA